MRISHALPWPPGVQLPFPLAWRVLQPGPACSEAPPCGVSPSTLPTNPCFLLPFPLPRLTCQLCHTRPRPIERHGLMPQTVLDRCTTCSAPCCTSGPACPPGLPCITPPSTSAHLSTPRCGGGRAPWLTGPNNISAPVQPQPTRAADGTDGSMRPTSERPPLEGGASRARPA